MADPRAFRDALAYFAESNRRWDTLINGDPRDADDIPGSPAAEIERDSMLAILVQLTPTTRDDLVALAHAMGERGVRHDPQAMEQLSAVLRAGVLAIHDRPRFPRLARPIGAYGAALVSSALSYLTYAIASMIVWCTAPPAKAEPLRLLFGVRAIGRELGLSRKQVWSLHGADALPTFTLAGVLCARRERLRAWIEAAERKPSS